MSKWKFIDKPPAARVMVEFFAGNLPSMKDQHGKEHPHDPTRDVRRSLGYWDGRYFRNAGTGHEIHDDAFNEREWLPTHYRVLEAAPLSSPSSKGGEE